MIQVEINGQKITLSEKKTILQAALDEGIYIPHLCFYNGLLSPRFLHADENVYQNGKGVQNDSPMEYQGCNLCLIEIEGKQGYYHACTTVIKDRMNVFTETVGVHEERKKNVTKIIKDHPHACLVCELAVGCDRKICSMNIPEQERCCWKYGNCEFQEIISYVGINPEIQYRSDNIPVIEDNPVFSKDYNLCINCFRCISVCKQIAERDALGFIYKKGKYSIGWKNETPKKSGCKYCSACVDVCPTGSLKEKKPQREKTQVRLKLMPPKLPPQKEQGTLLDHESLPFVPEKEGVYILYDENRTPIQISGTENLKEALREILKNNVGPKVYYYIEEEQMFMMRERQLIQQHLKKYKELPIQNQEIDDLF